MFGYGICPEGHALCNLTSRYQCNRPGQGAKGKQQRLRHKEGRVRDLGSRRHGCTAVGSQPVRELEGQLREKVAKLYVIGYAASPRKITEAIQEGLDLARQL